MSNKILIIVIIILVAGLGLMVWKISRPAESLRMSNKQSESNSPSNTGAQSAASQQQTQPAAETQKPKPLAVTDNGQLQVKTLTPGSGAEVKSGDTISVHYTGWLLDGTKFDSSLDRGEPFAFQVGTGSVIPGWDQGVVGMKIGEKRQLVVPYMMAYGENDYGPIPGKSTLVFEVQLLGIQGAQ